MNKQLRNILLATVILATVLSYTADAQILYGSLVGNVTDPTGGAVSAANISITNQGTNVTRQVSTDATGAYRFTDVVTGTYDLKVEASGFGLVTKTGVPVTINSITRSDVRLQLAIVSTAVSVTSGTAVLQADRSEVRSEIVKKQLVDLPVPVGRNYQQLFLVLPGFSPPQNQNSIPTNPARALNFTSNGSTTMSNNIRIDGASAMNVSQQAIASYIPALEAIETVNVVSGSYDAEQGLVGGAAINVQIKSGTNEMHGSAFEYHTDQHLKARPFFTPAGFTKPKLVYNQFGGTVGGPIKRDKLFYFVSFEKTYDRRFAQMTATVPTAAIKQGDMSAGSRPIYDPTTGDAQGSNRIPFANSLVPASRISAISRKISDMTPNPNLPGLTSNYYAAAPFIFDRYTVDSKVNWNASEKLIIFGRFGVLPFNTYNQQVFGDQLGGPPINGGNPGYGSGATYSMTAAGTYLFSPNFVLDTYYGWTRQDTKSDQPRLDEKIGLDFLGIPGTNGPRSFEGGWPRFRVSNYTNVGINENFMPYTRRDPEFQYVANFNWTKHTHSVRFGMDLSRQDQNQQQAEFGDAEPASGGFLFTGGPATTRGGPSADQFSSYAAFLMGLPSEVGRNLQVPNEFSTRLWGYSFYIRDQWAVGPKLTLSYGVRWEYIPFPTRADRGLERYDPDTNKMLVCGVGTVPRDCGVHSSKRQFAPRVGFAYRPTETSVIRGGYGITIDPYALSYQLRTNYPILAPLVVNAPNSFQPSSRLQDGIPLITAPDLGNGIIDLPGNFQAALVSPNFQRSYIQSWNLTLQKQVRYGFTAQAGYVGTRAIRVTGGYDLNAGQVLGGGVAGEPLLQRFGRTASTSMFGPVGNTSYNALQASLERRFSRGLQFAATYTWSKAIGDYNVNAQAPQYWKMNYTVADFDRTHMLHFTNIWELPFGKGKQFASRGRLAPAVLGGWQVNNVISMMTGRPFSVTADDASLDMPGNAQRADQIKPSAKILGSVGPNSSFFDPLAFASVNQARFGTAGYNSMRGPGVIDWDFGLFREFRATERIHVQFRAEAFNFTNTPHFSNPGSNVSNMSLNPDGSVKSLGGFSVITSTMNLGRDGIDERQFRFGLRFSF